MKKVLPLLLILLGVVEIILGIKGIKPPVFLLFLLGGALIAFGAKILVDCGKKK